MMMLIALIIMALYIIRALVLVLLVRRENSAVGHAWSRKALDLVF